MGPFVLILSYGSTKPIDEIVQKIQAATKNSSTNQLNTPEYIEVLETKFPTYNYNIKNKYFETVVKLLPFEDPINTIPVEILQETEAVICTFDSTNKSFLTHIPKLCDLIEKYNIQLGLLVTSELSDNLNEGLSYADIKEACKTSFDVIETLGSKDDEDTLEQTVEQEENYSEIIEALDNHVWSNVAASSSGVKKESKIAAIVATTGPASEVEDELNEEQLEAYESLLANIVNFKSNTSNLNRDQLFDQAEKLAEMFADFMGDD